LQVVAVGEALQAQRAAVLVVAALVDTGVMCREKTAVEVPPLSPASLLL
jgi:hypothetical protein